MLCLNCQNEIKVRFFDHFCSSSCSVAHGKKRPIHGQVISFRDEDGVRPLESVVTKGNSFGRLSLVREFKQALKAS